MRATGSAPDQATTGTAWPLLGRQPELAWLLLWLSCVAVMVAFPDWQVAPLDAIWISLALLYGFRLGPSRRTLALTATAVATTAAALGDDMVRHLHIMDASAEQIPLLTTMFVVMAWQAHRRVVAGDRAQIAAEAERLLLVQRQFLQDASHQLRTPITIALGHAELLARELSGRQQQRDIHVVVGELERLRTLSDRLLLIAASENPDFLTLEPAELDALAIELLRRWQPTARRRWQLGRIDPVTVPVDSERLSMALDALVENAIKHTGPDDMIRLTISHHQGDRFARIAVEDSGEGIAEADVPHIFERFRTAPNGGARGTGLGLALVEAIARGHGGEAIVLSKHGEGSRFELLIPAEADQACAIGVPASRPGFAGQREAS